MDKGNGVDTGLSRVAVKRVRAGGWRSWVTSAMMAEAKNPPMSPARKAVSGVDSALPTNRFSMLETLVDSPHGAALVVGRRGSYRFSPLVRIVSTTGVPANPNFFRIWFTR